MRLMHEFPWFTFNDAGEKNNLREDIHHLFKLGCQKSYVCCQKIAHHAKEHYPRYRSKAKEIAKISWACSQKKGRELYDQCRKHGPVYLEKGKKILLKGVEKVKSHFIEK